MTTTTPPQAPPRNAALALLVIAMAQLMLILDVTITNVALPSIQSALELAPTDLNWVITAYALTFGGLLLLGGRLGDLFGRRRVFRVGLTLFAVASLAGGLATDAGVLIGARALQGVGAAITAPTALSLLLTTFPAGPARTRALGVYGAMGGVGGVVGLLLGGALTGYLDWRWVLFVNVPIALLILAGSTVLPLGERGSGRLDVPGAITATAGVAALVYAINRASTVGWTSLSTIGFAVAALALLTAFALIERRSPVAMLPPRLLRNRARVGAYSIVFLVGIGLFSTLYFLTLYLQRVEGYSPMQAGLAFLPFAIGAGAGGGAIGPRLLARFDERTVTAAAMLVAAAAMAWFSLLTPGSNPFAILLPAQLVAGIGVGITMVASTVRTVRDVDPTDTGIAAGLLNTSQQLGGALGLAILTAIAAANGASSSFLSAGLVFLLALGIALVAYPRTAH